VEITAVFVAASLTILGYSLSDSVVVFDRVRENVLRLGNSQSFAELVHRSVMQTLVRSLNTTFTTLLALIAIYLFGGESIKYFALALIIGIFAGAYSSIFIASPILVWLSSHTQKAPAVRPSYGKR
jgi:preprotein translocase subunit SecF